jgi:hypothetical protein
MKTKFPLCHIQMLNNAQTLQLLLQCMMLHSLPLLAPPATATLQVLCLIATENFPDMVDLHYHRA